jgi:hypothetical protein
MIITLIYIILIIALVYISIDLDKELFNGYYKKDLPNNTLGTGKFFFIPLIFPAKYFNKEKIKGGYVLYLFSIIALILSIYLFVKLIQLSR